MTTNTGDGEAAPRIVVAGTTTDQGVYRLINTTALPALAQVRFYEETVRKIVDSHPEFSGELPSVIASIGNTVANPTTVHHSLTVPGRSYVFVSHANTFAGAPMCVAVKVVDDTSGRVATAYYSVEGYGGAVAWPREDGDD